MKYALIFEKGATSYGAYLPDLPGCFAVGETLEETRQIIREAIQLHLKGMREDGDPIPVPSSMCEYVEVADLVSEPPLVKQG